MGRIGLEQKNTDAHKACPVNKLTEISKKADLQKVQNQVHILAIYPELANIITAVNVARNKLDGLMNGIGPLELRQLMQERTDLVLLDVRTPAEYRQSRLADSTLIPLASLRARFPEIDRNRPVIAFCNYSLRAYEAAFILKKEGFKDVRVLDGGLEMWPYEKLQ